MRIFSISIILGMLFMACDKQADNFQVDADSAAYFPTTIGKYWIYEMDSIIYDPLSNPNIRQSISQIKEEITDTLLDNNGVTLFKIEQFRRANDSDPWEIMNVFTTQQMENQILRTEENLRFIKAVFPLTRGKSWDGNIFFDERTIITVAGETLEMFKDWKYRILNVDQVDTIGVFPFESVLTIEQADSENLIEYRQSYEKYAKDVGLIYRELQILDTQCINTNPDCEFEPWEDKAEKGFILKQRILDHN